MREGALHPSGLPARFEPEGAEEATLEALLKAIADERPRLDEILRTTGGILFRGFAVDGLEEFQQVVGAFGGDLLNYVGGKSKRSKVSGKIYTSTEWPSDFRMALHNELSYSRNWPRLIFFYCDVEPQVGGATPIGDSRRILARLRPELQERFRQLGVRYTQNLHGGYGVGGKSWQETFETDDVAEVERVLEEAGASYHWKDDEMLWIAEELPAIITHPETGEEVWFNQVDTFHPSYLNADFRAELEELVGEDGMPTNAYYGDGSPISDAELEEIREAMRQETVEYPWQHGDLLVLDNVLTAHGRAPYEGPRRILVAMS